MKIRPILRVYIDKHGRSRIEINGRILVRSLEIGTTATLFDTNGPVAIPKAMGPHEVRLQFDISEVEYHVVKPARLNKSKEGNKHGVRTRARAWKRQRERSR